ncbi:MAG: hypothetical protein ABI780_04360, partial [Ardenticatenales bacterium]
VAATDGGVTTIDVRDPARPDVIGALPLIGGAGAVAITGTTAYATTWDGLAAVDVGDSAHPAVRGPRNPYCGTERYRALAVTGGRAWTGPVDQPFPSTFHSCGLAQTDAVGSSYLAFAFRMRGIASAGDAALFAGQHVGLTSIRWPAPPDSSPPTGWSMPALGDVTGLHGASSVVRASDADSELWTFDTAVASAPVPVDRSVLWPMPEQADRLADRTGGLAVDGDVAFQVFLGGYRYGGSVAAIALAPLAQPTVIGQWRSSDVPGDRRWGSPDDDHPTSPYGPYLSGDTLYVTGPSVALTALDVASPAAVRWLGRFGEPESGFSGGGLAPDGPRAWLALYKRGLGLLDVSDPTAPRLIDRFALPDSTRDVALVGGDVLASTVDRVEPVPGDDFPPPPSPGHGLLVVLDAATHRPVARLPTDVPGDRLVVDGGRALLYGEGRIEVVDIRDPRRPVTVGAVRTGAADSPDVRPLAVVGDTIWAGTGELGISIYRLTEGETFTPSPPITPRAYLPYGLAARP